MIYVEWIKKAVICLICCGLMFTPWSCKKQGEDMTMKKLAGHEIEGNTVRFIFDEKVYDLKDKVNSVTVVGDFTHWISQPAKWGLIDKKQDGVWIKEVALDLILPGHKFTFLVNQEQWMSPPAGVDPEYLLENDQDGHTLIVGGEPENPFKSRLQALKHTAANGNCLPYRLLKPDNYNPAKKYPLVVFLHGSGERGTNNHTQIRIRNGAYEFLMTARAYQFFMLVPQCPPGQSWSGLKWGKNPYVMNSKPSQSMHLVMELIEKTRADFSIDPARIYTAGLSMGGMGTWDLVIRRPQLFAAAITVCGGYDPAQASLIKHIPFKVFHGSADPVVPVQGSRTMVAAVNFQNNLIIKVTNIS